MKQDLTALNQRLALFKIREQEGNTLVAERLLYDSLSAFVQDIAAGEFDNDLPLLKEFARRYLEV